jgi:alginate O-acetyltransferase complex protein AlgI
VLFTEPAFLFLFLPVVLALYFSVKQLRNTVLLLASVIFYAKGGGAFIWLMLGLIAFNYGMAIWIDRSRPELAPAVGVTPRPCEAITRASLAVTMQARANPRLLLGIAITVNLASLGIFKYANFFADNVNSLFLAVHVRPVVVPRVLLPIGISFFAFHAISYVVDVYRREATAQNSPVRAALYLLLFPQLIAGPIIRYHEIADQLAARIVTREDFAYGIRRFIIGLAKKMLIANVVAVPADRIFGMPGPQLTAAYAWLGVACYTLQIYFDFSGYSDMAVGLGRLFGFRFPENFRYPYIAQSVQEFWRRWHLSLSAWFRDYLYVPLGGNRVSAGRTYANLVIVFFLCGLWHGARWTFVVWGLFHGGFLVIERLGLARSIASLWPPIRHAYLLLVVMIGWVFFRADTISHAMTYLAAMAGFGRGAPTAFAIEAYLQHDVLLALLAGTLGAAPIVPAIARLSVREWESEPLATAALLLLLVASIVFIAASTYNPFIYFRF